MKKRTRKKRYKKTSKKTLIVVACLLIFGIIVIVGLYQNWLLPQNQSSQQKVPAAEYFEIFDAGPQDAIPHERNASGAIIAWEMYSLRYKLKAVKGDAHNVVIKSWAMAEPDNFEIIPRGENVTVFQETTAFAPYLLEMDANGKFPFVVKITSSEAEGEIVIEL